MNIFVKEWTFCDQTSYPTVSLAEVRLMGDQSRYLLYIICQLLRVNALLTNL